MAWKRRKLLGALAGTGAVGMAGCVSVDDSGDGGSGGSGGSGGGATDESGSGSSDGESGPAGEAEFWYELQEGELQLMEDAIADYNGSADYAVEGVNIAEMQDRLTSSIPTGEGPELFMWAHDWAGDFADSGFLSAQTGELDVDLGTYTEAAQGAAQFQGETYGLPVSAETVALLYNKEMVDEPPETIEEMKSIMEEHHDPANNQYGLSYNIDAYFISGYVHAFDGFYYRTDGHELGLTNEETLRGLRVITEDLWPYAPNDTEYEPQVAVFHEGNAPFAVNGPWELGNVDFDVGVAELPAPEGGTPAPYSGIQMVYFADGIEEDPDRAAAGRDFAQWYTTNTDVLQELAEEQGFIPVLDELAGSEDLPEAVQGFSASAAAGTPMPAHPRMNDVWSPTEDAILNVLTGEVDPEEAMAEAESRIRENWE
ncbi:extracellular solute-binding protein [Haloparvum sedimenti]|uniref:extracellular solute-binding protein n=1 Tax=Haloparvum sedimenti TaxID=1678448 RepID=UPI00071E88CF|nr:extracellular solute-binding protein [Haloparvum sedimenti]